jgi:beta-glucosidase
MDLSYWNDNTQSWYAEPGTFNVLVGSSSRDIRLQGSFTK